MSEINEYYNEKVAGKQKYMKMKASKKIRKAQQYQTNIGSPEFMNNNNTTNNSELTTETTYSNNNDYDEDDNTTEKTLPIASNKDIDKPKKKYIKNKSTTNTQKEKY